MKNIALLLLLVLLAGCYSQTYIAGGVEKPVMMSGGAAEHREYTVVKHFTTSDRSGWFLFALM